MKNNENEKQIPVESEEPVVQVADETTDVQVYEAAPPDNQTSEAPAAAETPPGETAADNTPSEAAAVAESAAPSRQGSGTAAAVPKSRYGMLRGLVGSSIILRVISALTDLIYRCASDGLFGWIFTGYDRLCDKVRESMVMKWLASLEVSRLTVPVKRVFMRGFEDSYILGRLRKSLKSLLTCQLYVYGVFLISFGLYSVAAWLLSRYAFNIEGLEPLDLLCGFWMVVMGIPLLTVHMPLGKALAESRAAGFLLFGMLGIRRSSVDIGEASQPVSNIAFIAGMLFGLLTFAVSPMYMIAASAAVIILLIVLKIPEAGVLLLFVLMPFLPTMALAAVIAYTCVCWFLKLIRGKRSLHFEVMDAAVLIFMLMMLLGGLVSVSPGSRQPSLLFVCFMLGYFLTVNLIRTTDWVKRCVFGGVFSAVIVSIYGIYEYFSGVSETIWQDKEMFEDITGRVVSTLGNPNVLGEYLIMLLPFALTLLLLSRKASQVFTRLCAVGALGLCLIYTWSRGAWLGFLFGMLIFMLLYTRKTMYLIIAGICALPFLPMVLPATVLNRFLSIGNITDTSTSYRVNIWRGVIDMASDHLLGGLGISTHAFTTVYPQYSLAGIESAPHSHNLFLQITVELGIIGLIVFLGAMIIFMMNSFTFYRCSPDRERLLISAAGFSGIMGVLLQGMTDYIWYNYRVFLMFWLIVGLTTAVRRAYEIEYVRIGMSNDMRSEMNI